MEFLRKMARDSASSFKDLADTVWAELGDANSIPEEYKRISKSAGKYALTAQLLMIMNFPDNAEVFRDGFNITNEGPTGSKGFQGSPVGSLLEGVAEISAHRNAAAIGTQGNSDVTQTSTYDDLDRLLPQIREMGKPEKPTKKGRK